MWIHAKSWSQQTFLVRTQKTSKWMERKEKWEQLARFWFTSPKKFHEQSVQYTHVGLQLMYANNTSQLTYCNSVLIKHQQPGFLLTTVYNFACLGSIGHFKMTIENSNLPVLIWNIFLPLLAGVIFIAHY